jgi:hypothetical protein
MKVFLSWSGDRSSEVAKLFNKWLPKVIQSLKPWLSTKDIGAGSLWDSELQKSLESHTMGMVFLTPENKEKPWVLFEAGALSKGLSMNRVFTVLMDLQASDFIDNPLSKFNHTFDTKESFKKLLQDINALTESPLSDEILNDAFDKNIDSLLNDIKKIMLSKPTPATVPQVDGKDVLNEVLQTVRALDNKIRDLDIQINYGTDSYYKSEFKRRPRLFLQTESDVDVNYQILKFTKAYVQLYKKDPSPNEIHDYLIANNFQSPFIFADPDPILDNNLPHKVYGGGSGRFTPPEG